MPASAFRGVEIPSTILESSSVAPAEPVRKVQRTPQAIYRSTEATPLVLARDHVSYGAAAVDDSHDANGDLENGHSKPEIPWLEDDVVDSDAPIVTLAIYVNFAANLILLAGKFAVVLSVPSVSVLASLVDAMLDFLSTVIVWITTVLIRKQDHYRYPIGRRRLEPLGVLIFSVIMITSFVQVGLEAITRLLSPDHEVIELSVATQGFPSPLPRLCHILTTRTAVFRPSPSCSVQSSSRVCAGSGAAWSITRAFKHCGFNLFFTLFYIYQLLTQSQSRRCTHWYGDQKAG